MLTTRFDYKLPRELIAQYPTGRHPNSRLLVVKRATRAMVHTSFAHLRDFLRPGDVLVVNDTKVIPARLWGHKETGGKIEVLLLKKVTGDGEIWECLVKRNSRVPRGTMIEFGSDLKGVVVEHGANGRSTISFECEGSFWDVLGRVGHVPLPPYIRRGRDQYADRVWYQTIFARYPGAVAAPTAGLHFTPELRAELEAKGVIICPITLHVGLGSFIPLRVTHVEDHAMEGEYYDISIEAAECMTRARQKGGRVVAVGTTTVRALETVSDNSGQIHGRSGITHLYIYPGYRFKVVDALITNFHLPRSSLILLVAAFGSEHLIMSAYGEAIKKRYRFFSYGDGMLIM